MYRWLSRRSFLILTPGAALAPALAYARQSPASAPAAPASAAFPSHDPALAREMVAVAHGNVARVRELVTARPTLSNAAWDWGYGDWETALGAASHVAIARSPSSSSRMARGRRCFPPPCSVNSRSSEP